MDVDEVAEELYGLPLDAFTAAKSAWQKRAKAELGPAAAAQIQALKKPNLAAWLANQTVRLHPDQAEAIVLLGQDVRRAAASAGGEQLREFGARERQLTQAFIGKVAEVARDAARTPNADVLRGIQDTCHAVVVDEDVADVFAAGRLTETVQRFGFVGATPGLRLVERAPAAASTTLDPGARAKATTDAIAARDEAARLVDAAQQALAHALDVAAHAEAKLLKRRREVDDAVAKRHRAERAHTKAAAQVDAATDAADEAKDRLADAEASLEELHEE